jgi:hypothetical protein
LHGANRASRLARSAGSTTDDLSRPKGAPAKKPVQKFTLLPESSRAGGASAKRLLPRATLLRPASDDDLDVAGAAAEPKSPRSSSRLSRSADTDSHIKMRERSRSRSRSRSREGDWGAHTADRLARWKKGAVDFDRVRRVRVVGKGLIGTVYLATYDGEEFALKTQKIRPSWAKPSMRYSLWRELYAYKYVDELPACDKKHFNELVGFRIQRNCDHVQKRNLFLRKMAAEIPDVVKMDRSSVCSHYLLRFIHGESLFDVVMSGRARDRIGSICKQVFLIHDILWRGRILHNDLHLRNIMVVACGASETIRFGGRESHSCDGILLKAIDMGNCTHAAPEERRANVILDEIVGTIAPMMVEFDIYRKKNTDLLLSKHQGMFDAYAAAFSKCSSDEDSIKHRCLIQFCIDHPRLAAQELSRSTFGRVCIDKQTIRAILRAQTTEELRRVIGAM